MKLTQKYYLTLQMTSKRQKVQKQTQNERKLQGKEIIMELLTLFGNEKWVTSYNYNDEYIVDFVIQQCKVYHKQTNH